MSSNCNLLIVFNTGLLEDDAIEQSIKCLKNILQTIELPEQFCSANELVDRNRITSKNNKILKEARNSRLRPFRFLINKN